MEQCWLRVMLCTWCPLHLITATINPSSLFFSTEPAPHTHVEDVIRDQHKVTKSHKAELPLNLMPLEPHMAHFIINHFIINFIIQSALPTTVDTEIWPKALQANEQRFASENNSVKSCKTDWLHTTCICKNKIWQISK